MLKLAGSEATGRNYFRNKPLFAVYRCLNPMHSIISIFYHYLLFNFILFSLSTWPLTFNLWHLLLKWLKIYIVSSRNIQVKHKNWALDVLHTRKIVYKVSSISVQKIVMFAKNAAHQKHGIAFVIFTGYFIKWLVVPYSIWVISVYLPDLRTHSLVCVRYIFAQRCFTFMSNHINFCVHYIEH